MQAQEDSSGVANTLKTLAALCKNVDFSDPKTISSGTFYKAAPYILYRGEDKSRAWKDFADYSNPEEKKGVDEVCIKINRTINKDSAYRVVRFFREKESEGLWLVLEIAYARNGTEKKALFAFLYVKGRYGLGDIDTP